MLGNKRNQYQRVEFNIDSNKSQIDNSDDTSSGFSFIPLLNGGGSSKIARVGMALGSMLAVTTCLLAIAGQTDFDITESHMSEDDLIRLSDLQKEGWARHL